MFKKIKKLREIANPSIRTYVLTAFVVFLAFLGVTVWTWNNARHNIAKEQQITLANGASSATDLITNTINTYAEVLRSSDGLFLVNQNITENEWVSYVEHLNIARFPGMQGISYSEAIPKEKLADFLANNKQADGSPYTIQPDGVRDLYVINRYIVSDSKDKKAFTGFDIFTEPVRRKAMEQARDSGQLTVTGNVARLSDKQPGFNLFIPVYDNNLPQGTVQERQAALRGFVSSGIRIKELLEGLFGKAITKDSAIQFFEGDSTVKDKLVYQSPTYDELIKKHNLHNVSKTFEISGNKWTLAAVTTQTYSGFGGQTQRRLPDTILWGGIIMSVLISSLLLIIMVTRAHSITNEKNREVQEVKDSLISLASHQLRTPATGVKQFISMVLEGYAGDINSEQRSMLEKAYVSNERQLDIINQILHVTRADSGRLVLNRERLDINELVRGVIEEHRQSISARKQKVTFRSSAKKMFIKADKQYLAMAIDNLLSNANKYSYLKKEIKVNIRRTKDAVVISVADKGVGIEEDDMHLLFQKFSRIQNELSVEAGGNGIGLYLCREIVNLHGGTIEVESKPGNGSTFTITLPRI